MNFCKTDPLSLFQLLKCQEKEIKLKRRWLLGLPITRLERKKLNKVLKNRYLSESLLREDDMFYESVRTHVEGAFGARSIEKENCTLEDDMILDQIPNLKRLVLSCLDNLTTKGLYLFAMIVSGGSVKCERMSRRNFKKIIKCSLSSVLSSKTHNDHQLETRKQIFQLLTNPQHFRDRSELFAALRSQSYHDAVVKVLHGLQKLPSQTLISMRRKLKNIKASIPQLQPCRQGWARNHLIKLVDKISREMLSQHDGGNDLQEPLAKAMAVADLSLKLKNGCHNMFSVEFYQFSPEVKSLQSDIMSAIWSLKPPKAVALSLKPTKVVALSALRDLQLLIEPKATIPDKRLRTRFVNILTEFLFECSDMDIIPKSLSQILNVINKGSNSTTLSLSFEKKHIEEEVDCILSVSSQTKQIVSDLLSEIGFDQDFVDTYMDPLEESDDSGSDEDDADSQLQEDRPFVDGSIDLMDSNYEAESVGDFTPFEFHPSTTMTEENVLSCPLTSSERLNSDSEKLQSKSCDTVTLESKIQDTPYKSQKHQGECTEQFSTFMAGKNYNSPIVSPDKGSGENVVKRCDFYEPNTENSQRDAANLFCEPTESMPTKNSACKDKDLATQDACDKTSMLAYNLIGHMLEEFAITEGLELDLSKSLYLSGDSKIEEAEETKKQSSSRKRAKCSASSRKRAKCSAIVQVVEERIPSFPDSSMKRLKVLMGL